MGTTAELTNPDWFAALAGSALDRAASLDARVRAGLSDLAGPEPQGADLPVLRSLVEDWLAQSMRERGLAFGAPVQDPVLDADAIARDSHTAAFLVALRHEIEVALEVAAAFGRDLSDRPARLQDLALIFVRLTGGDPGTGEFERGEPRPGTVVRALRLAGHRLRTALDASRTQPPWTLGPVHTATGARVGELAMNLHERRARHDRDARHLGAMDPAASLAAIEALAGVAWADGAMPEAERRLIAERIALAGFDRTQRRQALRAVEAPRAPAEIAADVPDPQGRRFVLEQVVLGSHADGRLDPLESAYVCALAAAFGMGEAEVARIEAEIAEFYARHQAHLSRAPPAGAMDSLTTRATERLTALVRENSARILQEIKETGALSRLLVKAGRGEHLSAEERRQVVAQLIDICKSIPALAIFALPGGALLLPVLIKVLPFNLLPSAFAPPAPARSGAALPDEEPNT